MKAIVNTGPGALELQDIDTPRPGPGQVRIRTAACAVCATDLEMIRGWKRTGYPAIPGHEWSGHIDAAGPGADPDLVGRPCVGENILEDGGEIGFEHPGGYAQYFLTEARNIHILPQDYPLDEAALIEPLAVVVHALDRANAAGGLSEGEPPLIFGDGPIGLLLAMLLLRRPPAKVTLIGGRPARLAIARELGHVETHLHQDIQADPARAVPSPTAAGYPFIVEASGSPDALRAAQRLLARGGKLLILGDYAEARADFPWNDLLHGEWRLIGSNASQGAWPQALRLAVQDRLPLGSLITHRFPAPDFDQAIVQAQDPQSDCVKTILQWDP